MTNARLQNELDQIKKCEKKDENYKNQMSKIDVNVNDVYLRPLDVESIGKNISGWESLLTEKSGGIYRKVEPDWIAFLTSEGYGLACWTIKHPGVQVKNVVIKMTGWTTFRNGQLGAALISGDKKVSIPLANQMKD
uniref:Type VI secretion system tip protein VgrG n=1 Tax=Meloidogyne hapla TaxID=6305 RepID=A0A1I8BWY3_MELHA